jgi:hypothetical protein
MKRIPLPRHSHGINRRPGSVPTTGAISWHRTHDARKRKRIAITRRNGVIRDETKFTGCWPIFEVCCQPSARVEQEWSSRPPPPESVAAVVRLWEWTCIRVGNESTRRRTSLRPDHGSMDQTWRLPLGPSVRNQGEERVEFALLATSADGDWRALISTASRFGPGTLSVPRCRWNGDRSFLGTVNKLHQGGHPGFEFTAEDFRTWSRHHAGRSAVRGTSARRRTPGKRKGQLP